MSFIICWFSERHGISINPSILTALAFFSDIHSFPSFREEINRHPATSTRRLSPRHDRKGADDTETVNAGLNFGNNVFR